MTTHVLTDITQQFQNATSGWHAYLFPIANDLFATLAIIEIAWAGIWWSLEKQEVNSLWVEMLKRFVSIGIFYSILLYSSTWIPDIINSFVKIGEGASHHTQLFPSDILDQGISIAGNIFKVFAGTGILSFGIATFTGEVTGLLVLIAFSVIAGLLVVTLVESYIVLGAGILMLGFASNRISVKYATNYTSYAMSVGAKLFMLYLIMGIGSHIADGWIQQFSHLTKVELSPFLEIAGGSLVYLFCAWAIPHKAESLMSGATNATLGGLVAAASVATTVAGGAAGVVRGAVGAASAGMEAIKQAHTIGKGLGGGGAGMLGGSAAAAFNLGASTLGNIGKNSSVSDSMKQKTAGAKAFFAERAEKKAANSPTSAAKPQASSSAASNTTTQATS